MRATPQPTPFALPMSPGGGGISGSPQLGSSQDTPKPAPPAELPKREATERAAAPSGPSGIPGPAGPSRPAAPPAQPDALAGSSPRSSDQSRDQAQKSRVAEGEAQPGAALLAKPKSTIAGAKAKPQPPLPQAQAADSQVQAAKKATSALRVSARVGLMQKGGRNVIALRFSPANSRKVFKVIIGTGESRRAVRRGPKNMSPILLSSKDFGQRPAMIPISVQTVKGARGYVLFAPTSVRLGEVAPESPHARYDGESLQKVLSQFAALTGLVILAEKPLDHKFIGDLPSGTPEAALEQIAADLDLKLERQGKVAYLLARR